MFKEKAIKGWIWLLAIMLAAKGWAVAKEATQGTGTAEAIEPKLVMEWKFDAIVDVIFDEATMTVKEARKMGVKGLEQRKATERIRISYPKVVVTEKAVRFLDERGKATNEVPLEKYYEYLDDSSGTIIEGYEDAFVSLDGTYLIKYRLGNECIESANLYTKDGRFTRELTKAGYNPLFSPDGDFFVTGGAGMGEMAIRFYDREGNLLKEHGDFIDNICIAEYKFSPDGKYVVAGGDKLYLFDNKGNQLWSYGIDGIDDMAISKDGNMIVAVTSSLPFKNITVYLFNKKGDLLWEYSLPFIRGNAYIALSCSGNYLVVSQENKIYFFNIITKKLMWEKEIEGAILETSYDYPESPIFISAYGNYLVVKGYDKDSCFVLLLDKKGKQIFRKKIDDIPMSAKISLDGKSIFVKTKKGFWIYENPAWQAEGGVK